MGERGERDGQGGQGVPGEDFEAVLTAVGPRLRAIRQQRGTTLAQLSETTGISVSTLSRLESGGRRPTLELLLPLARAYGVALDELVDAPPTGDPRVRLRPFVRHGWTYLPLARNLGGMQAYKMVVPAGSSREDCEQRTHEGYEWLYVLSGELLLRLGEHEVVLKAGEAAEFDTRTPHLFTNVGRRPVEFLSLFGPQGERVHVRARTAESPGKKAN
ncbi:helix-turn-helix domain-containing protein [Kitasatospora sp. NPDC088134]|uniref:helix-turn-helix domain-containing protein n=1 Tax=Kitasatospora sp. NPDC088134 TaxID=3364071 RepID=UPI0037FB60E5